MSSHKAADQSSLLPGEELSPSTADLQELVGQLRTEAAARTVLLHEVEHRVKNNLQLIGALIRIQAKSVAHEEAAKALAAVLSRVEAVATVHRRLYQGSDVGRFDVAAFARDLATDLMSATGRPDLSLEFDLVPVEIDKDKAVPLALVVNELITNVVQHAFKEQGGRLLVQVRPDAPDLVIGIHDDGVGLPGQELGQGSFGRTVVELLGRQLQAQVQWETGEAGTRVTLRIPLAASETEG